MSDETISVFYDFLGTLPFSNTPYYHETLVYTGADGFVIAIATAGPSTTPGAVMFAASEAAAAAAIGGSSPFGTLWAKSGPLSSFDTSLINKQVFLPLEEGRTELVSSGVDLSAKWASIVGAIALIDADELPYSAFTQNSNSVATTALIAAGITPPINAGTFEKYWSPAADNNLLSGVNLDPAVIEAVRTTLQQFGKNPDSKYSYHLDKHNGDTTLRQRNADGSYEYVTFDKNGNVTFDEHRFVNGAVTKTTFNNSDGSVSTEAAEGLGFDTYLFSVSSGKTTETIADETGDGIIDVESGSHVTTLGAGLEQAGQNRWSTPDGTQYVFEPSTGILRISGGVVDPNNMGNEIQIVGFDLDAAVSNENGFLGIHIPNVVSVSAGITELSAFELPRGTLVQGGSLDEGSLRNLTVSIGAPSDAPQNVRVDLSGVDPTKFLLNTGAEQFSFENGFVTVAIPAGRTSVVLSLLSTGNAGDATTLQLTATLVPSDPADTTSPPITSDPLAFNYVPGTPESNLTTIVGTTRTESGIQFTEYVPDGNNDRIDVSSAGPNVVGGTAAVGYDNDNQLGVIVVPGGDGNNLITLNGNSGIVAVGNGNNRIYGDVQIEIPEAIDRAKHLTATGQRGAFLSAGDGNNTIVGSAGNDVIFVGTGDNFIVLGPGDSTVYGGVVVDEASSGWQANQGDLRGLDWHPASYTTPDGARYEGNVQMTGTTGGIASGVPFGMGNNIIFGGSGASHIALSNGDNYVDAGSGNSTISGGMGHNTIFAGTGDVLIIGGGGDDYIDGETGTDTLYGGGGNNIILAPQRNLWVNSG